MHFIILSEITVFRSFYAMSYQHKPGNVKAKEREERKRRQEAELQRISKIQNFFTPAACAPNTDSLSLPTSTEHVNVEPSESLLNTPDATPAEINNSDVCPSGVEDTLETEAELDRESDRYPDILPKDTLRKDILPNGHFAERTFCRRSFGCYEFLPDSFVEYWVERGGQDC